MRACIPKEVAHTASLPWLLSRTDTFAGSVLLELEVRARFSRETAQACDPAAALEEVPARFMGETCPAYWVSSCWAGRRAACPAEDDKSPSLQGLLMFAGLRLAR